jgi:hypothetical protein
MELSSVKTDGCRASARGVRPGREQAAVGKRLGSRTVTTSKYVDAWLIPQLACDISHISDVLPSSLGGFVVSLAEAGSSFEGSGVFSMPPKGSAVRSVPLLEASGDRTDKFVGSFCS